MKSFYVDDCLKSYDNDERAASVLGDTINICADGGFRLHKIISNSREVMRSFSSDEWSSSVELDLDNELPTERALGVAWDTEKDELTFKININKDKPLTRRGMLSLVSAVYDPLGLASPFVLPAKILLQELCQKNLGWDDDIGDLYKKQFQKWLDGLPSLEMLRIPRCLSASSCKNTMKHQLHYFTDASEVGYGVVCYLRSVDVDGNTSCNFVLSKSRVAPLKKITIPRMELTAATVAVRMNKMLTRELELQISTVTYWTDSKSVLRYISNDAARYQTFVSNRVNVIRDGSEIGQWNYIDTKLNPADYASRGLNPRQDDMSRTWFEGPSFLSKNESEWPDEVVDHSIPGDDPEFKKSYAVSAVIASEALQHPIDKLIKHYSCWWRLRRGLAWLLLYVRKLRSKINQRKLNAKCENKRAFISQAAIGESETLIIKHVQKCSFGTELLSLQNDSSVTRRSPLYTLDPYMKDGVIRVGGRLERATVPFDEKHQIVLPKYSHVSHLILDDAHKVVGHMGKNSIVAQTRKKYWIIHCTGKTKSITSNCVPCRKYHGKRAEQKMADIPRERLAADQPPFSNSGVDYFGPFEVKSGRSKVKRYGVIFTCMTSRAIHLESACSLETDACINAIRRFIARRGAIKHIRSDNGTNLVGANADLKRSLESLDQEKLARFCLKAGVEWEFNPPLASHFGGIWERMIRTVRKVLFHLLHGQPLTDELFNTVLCEAEMIVNNRPLYDLESSDPNDPKPLTPNHLLLVQPKSDFPTGIFTKEDSYSKRRWRQVQYLASLFWKRWCEEYMHLLQTRSKWSRKRRNVSTGDIVLIMDTSVRNSWVLGRVTTVDQDKKGLVRSATVKTSVSEFRRPVDKLCVLLESEA